MNPAASAPPATLEPSAPLRTTGRGGLSLVQTFVIAWRAILGNPLRSVLTALGVIIGVGAVIALTSLGSGATSGIQAQLAGLGTNLLTVSSGQARQGGPPGLVRGGGAQTITLKDVLAIEALDGVAGIAPTIQGNMQAKAGAENSQVTVIGTWPAYATVRNSAVATGAWFTQADVNARKRLAVIGYQVGQDLYGTDDPLGQRIQLRGVTFTVVGVMPDKGNSGFASPNEQVFVPLSTYQQRLGTQRGNTGEPTVQSVSVQGATKEGVSDLQQRITDLLAQRHKKETPDDYDFNVQNQADLLSSVNQITTILTLFLGGVASISLLVGGIGIMNIMLVSVTERTREIGIRKALGAKPRDILTQFLVEAMVLSIGGGVIGIIIGLGLAFGGGRAVNITPVVSTESMLLAFGFSAAVGIFFGYYPAARAAKLDPVESLRYE
jgi:putative ABC transport system permease protein